METYFCKNHEIDKLLNCNWYNVWIAQDNYSVVGDNTCMIVPRIYHGTTDSFTFSVNFALIGDGRLPDLFEPTAAGPSTTGLYRHHAQVSQNWKY